MVRLDGAPLTATPASVPGSPWVGWRQRIAPGSHTLVTADPSGAGLKVLGVATYTSYAYPGGLDLSTDR